ncbi:helix-turn-helix domain-containing protein [Xanthobacter sp. TB0136]|uniref:helix-turn-helix domain-containing protein n=1 Tax=Xanthobacter sp. TB0136 TaxID=3459177 RepID=UPI00403950C1
MKSRTIADRLKAIRASWELAQPDFAKRADIPLGTLKKIEAGLNIPGGDTLLRYAAAGFSPSWVLTGQGPMCIDQGSEAGALVAGDELLPSPPITAPELLALVTDAIQRTYKDASASLSALDLGRLSAEKYNEIIQEIPEPEGWPVAVKMMAVQLRKDIASTAANPGARKREAS